MGKVENPFDGPEFIEGRLYEFHENDNLRRKERDMWADPEHFDGVMKGIRARASELAGTVPKVDDERINNLKKKQRELIEESNECPLGKSLLSDEIGRAVAGRGKYGDFYNKDFLAQKKGKVPRGWRRRRVDPDTGEIVEGPLMNPTREMLSRSTKGR